MKIIRFLSADAVYHGEILPDNQHARLIDSLFAVAEGSTPQSQKTLKIDKLLAPLVPTDILCIGLNYRDHAAESNSPIPVNPMLFIKGSNTLCNPFDPVYVPRRSSMIDYECELCVVIGKAAKHVSKEKALDYVFGYT